MSGERTCERVNEEIENHYETASLKDNEYGLFTSSVLTGHSSDT